MGVRVTSRLAVAFLAGCAILGLAGPAQATETVTVTQTFDLNDFGIYSDNDLTQGSTMSPWISSGNAEYTDPQNQVTHPLVALGVGDKLDLTINFAQGQALILGSTSWIGTYLMPEDSSDTPVGKLVLSGTLTLQTGDSEISASLSDLDDPSSFGQSFGAALFGDSLQQDAVIRVTSLHYIATLEDFRLGVDGTGPSVPTYGNTYNSVLLSVESGMLATEIPPVPEPATWAMMVGGFALAGCAMRARKHRLATAA